MDFDQEAAPVRFSSGAAAGVAGSRKRFRNHRDVQIDDGSESAFKKQKMDSKHAVGMIKRILYPSKIDENTTFPCWALVDIAGTLFTGALLEKAPKTLTFLSVPCE